MDEEDGLAAFSASNPSLLPENKERYILEILFAVNIILLATSGSVEIILRVSS